MVAILFFNAVLVLTAIYAGWRGGAPERACSVLLLLAAGCSALLMLDPQISYHHVEFGLVGIDVALLLLLTALASVANRYWPMWLAALQLVTVAAHGVRAYDSRVLPWAYWLISGHIAYLVLLLLAIATARHRRRLLAGFPEWGWSWQVRRIDVAAQPGAERADDCARPGSERIGDSGGAEGR